MENKYYYHGIEPYPCIEVLNYLYEFLKTGAIKTRSHVRNVSDDKLNHVCLFKNANEKEKVEGFLSAKEEWINFSFVFVINPDNVNAYKAKDYDSEALDDEWRVNNDIPFSDVVGVALPNGLEFFNNIDYWTNDADDLVKYYLENIKKIIETYGWFIEDSCDYEFTEKLDSSLNNEKTYKI